MGCRRLPRVIALSKIKLSWETMVPAEQALKDDPSQAKSSSVGQVREPLAARCRSKS